jgi:uncharacterized membrane protein YozB (DUF420 family)
MDITTISLALQLLVFALLIFGYYRFRAGDLIGHGLVLVSATVVHIGAIILRMIPAFSTDPQFLSIMLDPLNLMHWSHVALGLLAPALGLYISLRWVLHGSNPRFCRGKLLMRITFVVWFVSLLFGIVMYFSP